MTASVPLRLRALIGLTAVLKTITPANGYNNDLSDFEDDTGAAATRVFRGRNSFGDNDPPTLLAILESPHTEPTAHDSPRGSSVVIGPWDLLVQGFGPDDPMNPSDNAHLLMADVKRALIQERLKLTTSPGGVVPGNRQPNLLGLGNAVSDIHVGSGVVRPADELSPKAYFWLAVTLELSEDLLNPFS